MPMGSPQWVLRGYDEMLDQRPQPKRLCLSAIYSSICLDMDPLFEEATQCFPEFCRTVYLQVPFPQLKHTVNPHHSVINSLLLP